MEMHSVLSNSIKMFFCGILLFSYQSGCCFEEKDSVRPESSLVKMLKDPQFQAFLESEYRTVSNHNKQQSGNQNEHLDLLRRCFTKDYLEKYYPKVFVIRDRFFADMTVVQMLVVLKEIVEVFTEKPWIYFVNEQEKFVVIRYWEYIVDQLSYINEFLRKAYVDIESKKIISPEKIGGLGVSLGFGQNASNRQNIKPLFMILNDRQKRITHEFYALCFDYLIKLFNEGILLKDPRLADRFFGDLDFVMGKLQGSEFEPDYQEVLKTCKELRKILDHKCGIDEFEEFEEDVISGN